MLPAPFFNEAGRSPWQLPGDCLAVVAFALWRHDYSRAVRDAGLDIGLDEGIATINAWILEIEATTT